MHSLSDSGKSSPRSLRYIAQYNIARLCIALVWCVLMVNQDTTDIGAQWGPARHGVPFYCMGEQTGPLLL